MARVLESLGDARFRIGVFTEARSAFSQARRRVRGDVLWTADLLRKEAEVAQRLNHLSLALRTSTRAMNLLAEVESARAVAERSRLMGFYAIVREHQGRYRDAVAWGRRAETDARASQDPRALADAYMALHSTTALAGMAQDRPYGTLALELYKQLDDRAEQSKALNNLAVIEWFRGRGRDALAMFEEAERAAEEAGDTVGAAASRFNVGDVLVRQGRVARGGARARGTRPPAPRAGVEDFRAATVRGLGLARVIEGDPQGGRELLAEARAVFDDLGHAAEVAETDASIAEALLAMGSPREAEELVLDAERRAGRSGGQLPPPHAEAGTRGGAARPGQARRGGDLPGAGAGRVRDAGTDRAGVHPGRARAGPGGARRRGRRCP